MQYCNALLLKVTFPNTGDERMLQSQSDQLISGLQIMFCRFQHNYDGFDSTAPRA